MVAPSVAMLESMPALESLAFHTSNPNTDQIAVLEPLILAMNRRVAFQRLYHLCLSSYWLENIEWDRLLHAIACLPQLTSLMLSDTNLSPANMATFSALLGQKNFPTLQSLRLYSSDLVGDEGVERLVKGLLAPACAIRLKSLDLGFNKMGDKGMVGRFERLEALHLLGNSDVTGRGVCALARAVRASGGQKLSSLLRILVGCDRLDIKEAAVVEMASALVNICPRLKKMHLCHSYGRMDLHEKLLEIVRAAGYQHQVSLAYWLMDS